MLSRLEESLIKKEETFCSNTYNPLPVVLKKGRGVYVWDVHCKKYFDFLSSYSAVNQGHCNKKILRAFTRQARKLTLTSRPSLFFLANKSVKNFPDSSDLKMKV